MDLEAKRHELEQLLDRARRLEDEIESEPSPSWRPPKSYFAYYATTGFMLGIFGAMTSLLVNVIGAPIAGKEPLQLIRIYLTFPLGEKALELATGAKNVYAVPDGMILAIGCCLYLGTGMVLGVPFHVILARLAGGASLLKRLLVATVLALVVWAVNFYAIVSWLQPLLFRGRWITDPAVLPWWVAAATHLVYGWTMALVYPLGRYTPYRTPLEPDE